jgi:L-threonylcarbamoyladenylate synthase
LYYVHRGKGLALRIPDNELLQEVLSKTGPIVAPSANREGEEPAATVEVAKEYFGDTVDFYVDGGELKGEASTVISLENGRLQVIREGKHKINGNAI